MSAKIIIPIFAAMAFMQRNPTRIPDSPHGLLSPADGKVISIETDNNSETTELKIFLNLHDVHYQRSPISGTIQSVDYFDGTTDFCYIDGCPIKNKHIKMNILSDDNELVSIIQKAGGLFSRPIARVKIGQYISRGQTIGNITFGSGCYITFPSSYISNVSVGDKVKVGKSILANKPYVTEG